MAHTMIGDRSFAIVHRGQPGHFTQGATILHAELAAAGRHLYVIEELSTCPDSEDVFTYIVMNTKVAEAEIENLLIASEDIDPVNIECTGYVLTRASLGIIVEALFRSYDIALPILEGTDR